MNPETFLWSLCKGYDGDGWTKWDNTEVNRQLQKIRLALESYVDEDLYGRECNAPCRSRNTYPGRCNAAVSVDQRRCHHHPLHSSQK